MFPPELRLRGGSGRGSGDAQHPQPVLGKGGISFPLSSVLVNFFVESLLISVGVGGPLCHRCAVPKQPEGRPDADRGGFLCRTSELNWLGVRSGTASPEVTRTWGDVGTDSSSWGARCLEKRQRPHPPRPPGLGGSAQVTLSRW